MKSRIPFVLAACAALALATWVTADGPGPGGGGGGPTPGTEVCVKYVGYADCDVSYSLDCTCVDLPPIDCGNGHSGVESYCTAGYVAHFCFGHPVWVPSSAGSHPVETDWYCCTNYVCLAGNGVGGTLCNNTCTSFSNQPCGVAWAGSTSIHIVIGGEEACGETEPG